MQTGFNDVYVEWIVMMALCQSLCQCVFIPYVRQATTRSPDGWESRQWRHLLTS